MKNLALMTVFNTILMTILDGGLLFGGHPVYR